MTSIRPLFSWLLRKVWSVVVVFAILWLGAWVAAKFQELKQLGQIITQIQSIEAGVKEAAERATDEAQARVKELDQAALDAVEGRLQTLNEEIKQLSAQIPSTEQRSIAVVRGDFQTISDWAGKEVAIRARQEERDVLARTLDYRNKLSEYERWLCDGPAEMERLRLEHVSELEKIDRQNREIAPCANMTCATYPREISEQRGRYDDQPAVEGPDGRSEGFFRSGRIAGSPQGD